MSLSDQNRALACEALECLIEAVWQISPTAPSEGQIYTLHTATERAVTALDALRAEGRPSPEGEDLGPDDPTGGLPGRLMAIYGECANGRPINGGDLEVIEDAAHALAGRSPPAPEPGYEAEPVAWAMIRRDRSVLSVQTKPYHEGFAKMMEVDHGCIVAALYAAPRRRRLAVRL